MERQKNDRETGRNGDEEMQRSEEERIVKKDIIGKLT
jgi:hypothetical protein